MQVCKCLTQSNQILNSLHPSNSLQQSLCEHGECNFLLNSKRASARYEFLHLQTYKWSISSSENLSEEHNLMLGTACEEG